MLVKKSRILVLVTALLLIASLALTAYGAGKRPSSQNSNEPTSKFGGTLKIGTMTDPDTLNVLVSNSITTSWILDLIYPSLLTFNEKGEKVGYLAKEWKTSPDGRSVTYKLRDDMKWDDGKPVTSADVKYTAEVTLKETIGYNASLLKDAVSIDTPDATTVTFNLKKPSAVFATTVGYWLKVVPAHIWSTVGENKKFTNDQPVGAGPFKLTRYEKGQYWELEPQGKTWMAPDKKPYVDKIQFRVYPDMNTMILALKKGDIDAIANPIPPASVADLKATPGIKIGRTASLGYGHLTFNFQRPNAKALANKAVRQAIAQAVNKEAIKNIVLRGNSLDIPTPVSPVLGGCYNPNVKDYAFNLEAARKQLEKAGYKDQGGVRVGPNGKLEFTLIYDQGFDPMAKAVKMIADDLAKIGVKIDLQGMERNTYLARAKALDFDIYAGKWGVMDEPADYLGLLFLSDNWQKGGINYSGINDPKLDAMIKEAQGAMDSKTMKKKLFALQEYLHDQIPVITLWVETYNLAMSDKWAGWKIFPSDLRGFVDPQSLVGVYRVKR
ncbi:MAG: ABC transporter substrate-binding protein [Firmicutes bacterium]|nr:ABC transporter substrate-binding protein [Bacillota bacterium]